MNKVIRTARISEHPVILPIHIDRGLLELAFDASEEVFSEAEFEAAQSQDIEESSEFDAVEEETEPGLPMEEVEALIAERLKEVEARFLQEKEEEKEAAHQAGFEAGQAQGYAEGHAAGLSEGQAQGQDEIVRFQAMLSKIADRWDPVFKSADLDVMHLAFAVAQNIVGGVVDAHEDLVLQSVRDCLAHVQDTTQLTICVNPDDLAIVRANRTDWQEAYERIESMTIEADASIERGGCVIETPSGDIDGQISSRLEKLRVAILERLQGVPQETAPDVSDVIATAEVEKIDETETDDLESVETMVEHDKVDVKAEGDLDVGDASEEMIDVLDEGLPVDDHEDTEQDAVDTIDMKLSDDLESSNDSADEAPESEDGEAEKL